MKEKSKVSETVREDDMRSLDEQREDAHELACEHGADSYLDPKTGYQVMTAGFLQKREACCHSGCRHCPYGFQR